MSVEEYGILGVILFFAGKLLLLDRRRDKRKIRRLERIILEQARAGHIGDEAAATLSDETLPNEN
jgi:hypothetical protein